jgi:hypothetical protein
MVARMWAHIGGGLAVLLASGAVAASPARTQPSACGGDHWSYPNPIAFLSRGQCMIGRSLRHFKKLVRVRFSPAAGSPKTASNALLHHMAYFVVTEELRDRLSASAPARIVNTASAAHQGARLDFDDLRLAKSFGPMKAYASFATFFSRVNSPAGCKRGGHR